MSKYRQPFMKELKRQWAERFPAWQQSICAPVFWAGKDATFTNTSTLGDSSLIFHAVINFTPKSPGTFTCDVIVTPTLEPLGDRPPLRWPRDIPELPIGSYRIGWFVAGRDMWWRLADDAEQTRKLYEEVGVDSAAAAVVERQTQDWYAPSYAVPLPQIIIEAARHFSDTFERHVIPKLRRQ